MSEGKSDATAHLPDDPAILKEIISEQRALLEQQRREIEKLRREIDQLRRLHYGPRSERRVPEQMLMPFVHQSFPAELPPPRDRSGDRRSSGTVKEDQDRGHGRQKLPDHLPRVPVVHDVPEEQKRCGGCRKPLSKIGEETSEQLEYTPSQFKVLRHIRPKYACPNECEGSGVVTAAPPSTPIEKGLPGPGLLAHVCVSKFDDHLPLYRMQEIFARQGVHIARSTQCGWVAAAAELAEPLFDQMRLRVLESKKIHTDDVPVPVLDPDRKHAREGRLWVYLGDQTNPYVVFDYSPTHAETHPLTFLKDFTGFLQCDAYPGYDKVRATVVGCWAHARRYFVDAEKSDPARAAIALGYIRILYKIEEAARELSPKARRGLRQKESKRTIDELRGWMESEELSVLPESAMGKAMTYARNQWERLTRFLDDGDLAIDNNAAERVLRSVAIGRKNWLFAGSDEGGRRSAVIYSLIESAKRCGQEPLRYLTDLFARFPTHPARKLGDFLPDQWRPPPHPP